MKKRIAALALGVLLIGSLFGCAQKPAEDKMQIICTVFPQYDWVRAVLGEQADRAELTLLMDNGADLHNYQATAADLLQISSCDLFVYIGGESDEWVPGALRDPKNTGRREIRLLDVVEAREEEEIPGAEEAHEHDHAEEGTVYDEHIWLSLRNARQAVAAIAEALAQLDPEYAGTYRANAESYGEQLSALDARYTQAVESGVRKTLLFADRFPFRYLADDYGLTYYAAFSGCSAETEASFGTLAFLAGKVDELSLPVVLVIETSDQSVARSVIANTQAKNQEILVMDSLQSVTLSRVNAGETYLGIMEQNCSVLEKALH